MVPTLDDQSYHPPAHMHNRPTVLILAGRALTALITVWCLGCSAYEPLLDSLLASGASTGMSCGSEMGTKNDLASTGQNTVLSSPAAQAGYACGCGSCQSETPQSWSVATSATRIPSTIEAVVVEPTSITRAPVAPPPELRTL
jgi:hypothetical protein